MSAIVPLVQDQRVRVRRRMHKRRHLRRWLALALAVLLGVAAVAIWSALPAYAAVLDARAQMSAFEDVRASLGQIPSPAEIAALDAHAVRLVDDLRTVQKTWDTWRGPVLFVSGIVPSIHGQLEQVDPLLEYSMLVAQAGHLLRRPLESLLTMLAGRPASSVPALVADLAAARPTLRDATLLLERAESARKQMAPRELPSWVQQKLYRLDPLPFQASTALKLLTALPSALGADGVRDYLLIPQNSEDVRATGGFIGTVGVLRVDHGHAHLIDLEDSYEVDRHRRPDVDQPLPLRVHGWIPWYFRDANWSADYPTSARLLETFYQLGTRRHVDGVIAFDSLMLPDILNATGPVPVPGYHETLTAANAFQRIDYYANVRQYADVNVHQAFVLAAYKVVFDRLLTASSSAGLHILDLVRNDVRTRHLLLYANDPTVQNAIHRAGADGSINGTTHDYLYIVDTNTSTNKVAQLVQRHISYHAVIQPDRSILATVMIRYWNGADRQNLPHQNGQPNFNDFVRLYVPAGSTLLSTKGLNEAWWPTYTVHNKTQFSGYFALPSRHARTLVFHYRIPANADPGATYALLVQKQPGTLPTPLQVDVSSAGGVRLRGSTLHQATVLDADVVLSAHLSGGHPHLQRLALVTAEAPVTPGSHPEPWVTVPTGWVNLPGWAEVQTGNGWCVWGSHKMCHTRVRIHRP